MTAPQDRQPATEAGRAMHDWLGWHPVDGRDDPVRISLLLQEPDAVTSDISEPA